MVGSRRIAVRLAFATLAAASAAPALQPLDAFVGQALATHPDARLARATAEQRDAEAWLAGFDGLNGRQVALQLRRSAESDLAESSSGTLGDALGGDALRGGSRGGSVG